MQNSAEVENPIRPLLVRNILIAALCALILGFGFASVVELRSAASNGVSESERGFASNLGSAIGLFSWLVIAGAPLVLSSLFLVMNARGIHRETGKRKTICILFTPIFAVLLFFSVVFPIFLILSR